MKIKFTWNGDEYTADLSVPIDISIPLMNGEDNQPNAYGAPLYEATPVRSGEFIGSLEAGAPVNFFNISVNPHGNGTHTECVGHILQGPYSIRKCMTASLFVAELVTVQPEKREGEGARVTKSQLEPLIEHHADVLIVRTLPNQEDKKRRQYTGTNPPWFDVAAMAWIAELGYQHLLTDLPSVDPEADGGALAGHKAFWIVNGIIRSACTITEMIYAPENVPDGLYLLDLHTVALELDVSPSRPMLYVIEKAE
ncbi:MAG TPA: cyclase family protein [Saprospiraceae bacterium]|nr:cyclase family protein [Saprospiraceae bacterium]